MIPARRPDFRYGYLPDTASCRNEIQRPHSDDGQSSRVSQVEGTGLDASNWRSVIRERVEAVDWNAAQQNVEPFLEPGAATGLFGRESLLQVLSRSGSQSRYESVHLRRALHIIPIYRLRSANLSESLTQG